MGLLWYCIQISWFYYGKCPTTWIYHGTASKYNITMVNNMVSYMPKKLVNAPQHGLPMVSHLNNMVNAQQNGFYHGNALK